MTRLARPTIRADPAGGPVVHADTWVTAPVCYFEDLFVDRAARHAGWVTYEFDLLEADEPARGGGPLAPGCGAPLI